MQTIIRRAFIVFLLLSFGCSDSNKAKKETEEEISVKYFDYKKNPKSLSKINHFFVTIFIVAPNLNSVEIKTSFEDALRGIGIVFKDQDLTSTQRQISYFESASMQFMLGNIGEEGEPARIFPVLDASLKIIDGAEILKNQSKSLCTLWKSNEYFADDGEANEKAKSILHKFVQEFAKDYQKANPGSETPTFYLSPGNDVSSE